MTGTQTLRTRRRDALALPQHILAMSALLYTFLGLTVGTLHCSMRPNISPCTCTLQLPGRSIQIACERMTSFDQVKEALDKGNFTQRNEGTEPQNGEICQLSLRISHSDLEDLGNRSFQELGFGVQKLRLNYNNLTSINKLTFANMSETTFLSLADNALTEFPAEALSQMPSLITLDLGRSHLSVISQTDFKALPRLQYLLLAGNAISRIDSGSLPQGLHHLHIGLNQIYNLNGSISALSSLRWLFMNGNNITTLDGQLPSGSHTVLLHAGNNQLTKLPQELNTYPRLESLFLQNNRLTSLGGAVQNLRKLKRLHITNNRIEAIHHDDLSGMELLQDLQAGYNQITELNGSMHHLHALGILNLTHNLLPEFSLQKIKGLQNLRIVDLSHNLIKKIGGSPHNYVELHTTVLELRLEFNQLEELGGALGGLSKLERLNLSHNHLRKIAPDDLINLDDLRVLDISFNQLTTLEETSKTQLPKLEELLASNNYLTIVGPDFHGLPVLCYANLQYNKITTIGNELASKTRCKKHDVPHTLRIHFEGNPFECSDELTEAVAVLMKNHTEVYGVPDCSDSTTLSSEGE